MFQTCLETESNWTQSGNIAHSRVDSLVGIVVSLGVVVDSLGVVVDSLDVVVDSFWGVFDEEVDSW